MNSIELNTFLKNLENNTEEMVEQIMQWSNINSGSLNVPGLERMAAVLTQAFSGLECEGNVLSLPPLKQVDSLGHTKMVDLGPMLRFWKRPKAPIQVLLVGHMDTVFELEHPFQRALRKSQNIINGPGVADMKGGICVMLNALKAFEKSPNASALGWEVLINPDEEIGSSGSASFLAERAKNHQVGLLFEPAMDEIGTLAGERKGTGNFTIVVHGRAAHAGRSFEQGRNAITLLSYIVNAVDGLNGKQEGITLNVGQIQGGGAINIVPALAIARIDVRLKKNGDELWVKDQLESIIASVEKRDGFKVELHGTFTRKPKIITGKTQELYNLVKELGQEIGQTITWKPSGGCCDGNNLAEAGLPNVDTLGVCGGAIHSEEEYLLVDSLAERTKLTTAILIRLSEKGF